MKNLSLLSKCVAEISQKFLELHLLLEQENEIDEKQLKELVKGARPMLGELLNGTESTISDSTTKRKINEDDNSADVVAPSSPVKKAKRKPNPYGLKKPLSAYLLFCQEYREKRNHQLNQEDDGSNIGSNTTSALAPNELMTEMGKEWHNMNESDKNKYQEQAKQLKKEYDEKIEELKKKDEISVAESSSSPSNVSAPSVPHINDAASTDLAMDLDDDFEHSNNNSNSKKGLVVKKSNPVVDENTVPSIGTGTNHLGKQDQMTPEEKERKRLEKLAKKEKKLKKKLAEANGNINSTTINAQ